MHAVVNHLRFAQNVPPELFRRVETELGSTIAGFPGFHRLYVVQVSPEDVVLVILAEQEQTLNDLATALGNTWMREHVAPLLERPPERLIGPVIAELEGQTAQ
jgi:hypothetical protein